LHDDGGAPVELDRSMVSVADVPVAGWQLSAGGGYSVALDLRIDDDLRRAGLAREVIRLVTTCASRPGTPSRPRY
jgi:isoleucyl-tRNA synthetase